MEEKNQKPAYEKPCVYHLNDYKIGKGDDCKSGSNNGSFCSTGGHALGNCLSNGNSDSGICIDNGNGAPSSCNPGSGIV